LRGKGHGWKRHDALHLLPIIVGCGVVIFFNINTPDWRGVTPLSDGRQDALAFLWTLVKFSPFAYVITSVVVRYRIHQHLRRGSSGISEVELTLADVILIGFLVHWVWTLVAYFLADWVHWSVSDALGIINNYLIILLINSLFVAGLFNAEKLLNPEPIVPEKSTPVKNKEQKIAIIEKAIHEDKIYLEANLNIDRFSERLGLRVRDVSTIIKTHYGTNFFEFINKYRIDEVKRLLLEEEHKNDTILDIIYKAGFNSLSTFHRFFKRMVGVTPSEYRRQGTLHHPAELQVAPKA
jgi:AraC-like DNA-binding protein